VSFPKLNHFTAEEFSYPELLDETLLIQLDSMRDSRDDIIITINCDYRLNDKGFHGKGKAVDCVVRDAITKAPWNILRQFAFANRFLWGGIGFYPFWNAPGLHLDVRPMLRFGRRPLWWRDEKETYHYDLEDDLSWLVFG